MTSRGTKKLVPLRSHHSHALHCWWEHDSDLRRTRCACIVTLLSRATCTELLFSASRAAEATLAFASSIIDANASQLLPHPRRRSQRRVRAQTACLTRQRTSRNEKTSRTRRPLHGRTSSPAPSQAATGCVRSRPKELAPASGRSPAAYLPPRHLR